MPTEILSQDEAQFPAAHTAATVAKAVLLINGIPVVPLNDADANANNVFVYEASKVRVVKAAGQVWAPLEKIYWHDTNKNFTNVLTGAVLAGVVSEDAASADVEGIIHLSPFVNA